MRWQRWARLAIAGVGVGCAVAIYVYTKPKVVAPPPVVIRDAEALQQGGKGIKHRLVDGVKQGFVEWEAAAMYADRAQLSKAHVMSVGTPALEVWSDTLTGGMRNGQLATGGVVNLNGNVRFKTSDGLEGQADAATYDQDAGIVRIPGHVTYTQGRLSGEAMGATYDRTKNLLQLLDQTHATVAPDAAGAGGAAASSVSMTLARTTKELRMDQNASIVREGQTLSGDAARLAFAADESTLKRIELLGHAHVVPTASPKAVSPPEMHADQIDLDFDAAGQNVQRTRLVSAQSPSKIKIMNPSGPSELSGLRLDADLAPDGSTVTRLTGSGQVEADLPKTGDAPHRTIHATALTSKGNPKVGLTGATFAGDVVFNEEVQDRPARAVRSRTLDLELDGRLDAIKTAVFRDAVKVTDDKASASADVGTYIQKTGELQLRPAGRGGRPSEAASERLSVVARDIDLQLGSKTNDLSARIDVVATVLGSKNGRSGGAGLFDPSKEMKGFAPSMTYKGGEATFIGTSASKAKLSQDDGSEVVALKSTIETETNNLHSEGDVHSRFVLTESSGGSPGASAAPPKPILHTLTSDMLDYDDAAHLAVFTSNRGNRVNMSSPDLTLDTTRIDFTLGANRTVKRFDAKGEVDVVFEEEAGPNGVRPSVPPERKRRAAGDRLEYDAAEDKYILTGAQRATVQIPAKDNPGQCDLIQGARLVFSGKAGDIPKGQQSNKQVPCSTNIR